jgi:hypothetical protein
MSKKTLQDNLTKLQAAVKDLDELECEEMNAHVELLLSIVDPNGNPFEFVEGLPRRQIGQSVLSVN